MAKQTAKKPHLLESFGGYMSVDPLEAIEQNWEIIKSLPLPGSKTVAKQNTGTILTSKQSVTE